MTRPDREVTVRTVLRHAAACAALSALFVLPAYAEGTPKAPPAEPRERATEHKEGAAEHETQQERMKRCNATAKEKELKGDERRAFMSSCLRS
jgi:hypothetical protein